MVERLTPPTPDLEVWGTKLTASRTIDKYPTPGRGFLTNPHHHNLQDDKCPGGWACLELTEPLPYLSVKYTLTDNKSCGLYFKDLNLVWTSEFKDVDTSTD